MKKFSKLAAILAVCAFIFGGLLVSCSPHGSGLGLDDVQPSGGGAGGAGGGSGGGGGAPVAVTGITLNQASATIGIGETLSLTYTITPENATDKTVTWTSSDETVATVENGVIKAIKAGEATITAKAGDKTATCAVTVNALTLDLSTVTADTVIANNTTVTGTLGANVKISIADGATVTLKDVTINGTDNDSYKWAGLTCAGGATITLEGTNTVKGFYMPYPGVFVPKGKTLTIKGSGSLNASSNERGAGIGGCYKVGGISIEDGSCGTIVIEGGTITATGGMSAGIGCGNGLDCDGVTIKGGTVTATGGMYAAGIGSADSGSCGPISISGGTVTATGGMYAAGIGSGNRGSCGNITIANTVTKVTATKGHDTADSVGRGRDGGACGTITIGGTVYLDDSVYQNDGATVLGKSPYTYNPKLPTGGIDGLFSVSATKKVYFSKGNLRATYNGSWTWSFADHQYDAVGNAAANTLISGNGTVSANGSVDLFGWVGANSAFEGMAAFGISNSADLGNYGNTNGEALKNDWGTNAISNGGNVANYGWRTLTKDEWNYVLTSRAGADSKKGAATVNNVAGWILLPDAWTLPAGANFTAGKDNGFTTNSYTADQWAVMESAGAVFLPLTGSRKRSTVEYWTDYGYYWSATSASATAAYIAAFSASSSSCIDMGRGVACSAVRLVKDSE